MATLLNGEELPSLFYGTGIRRQGASASVSAALHAGYRAIDTASSRSFHNESIDGEGLISALSAHGPKLRREDIFVQTKYTAPLWQSEPWPYAVRDDVRLRVLKSFARSAQNLRVDAIDAYLLHGPLETLEETMIAWKALEEIVSHGGIRYLGICNVDLPTLEYLFDAATVKPRIVQNEFRAANCYDRNVKEFCRKHGMVYQVFGLFWEGNQALLDSDIVRQHSNSNGWSIHQALYHLLIESFKCKDLIFCVVDGASQEEHMAANLTVCLGSHHIDTALVDKMLSLLRWD